MQTYLMRCRVNGYFTVTVTAEDDAEAAKKANTACAEADFGALADVDWSDPKIDEVSKIYSCYEPGFEGSYREEELEPLYQKWANKAEYSNFDEWLWDMLRSGVLEQNQ